MTIIKPCPFCGAAATAFNDVTFHGETGEILGEKMWFVWCTECSALVSGATEDEAIAEWNRRASNDSD